MFEAKAAPKMRSERMKEKKEVDCSFLLLFRTPRKEQHAYSDNTFFVPSNISLDHCLFQQMSRLRFTMWQGEFGAHRKIGTPDVIVVFSAEWPKVFSVIYFYAAPV